MEARGRRGASSAAEGVRWEWFTQNVLDRVNLTMEQRVRLATAKLLSAVTKNISTAVTVGVGPRGGRVVTGRSRPGEYPHAETTQLMKTLFSDVRRNQDGSVDGYVGTPLSYGLILETKMSRSFLVRTLNEESEKLGLILTEPIRD
jgi:hypothetical protein